MSEAPPDQTDTGESTNEVQLTFKVKTSGDGNHTITMADSATVLALKTKLAGTDYEDVPVERQRLIYSGRVMKNEDTLATYKIKNNNTIHMVKSAASNSTQPSPNSAAAPQAAPQNLAAGTANNPLAGLTGARYAGLANLPGADMFGPDGGMTLPSEDEMMRLMSNPDLQSTMSEALNNPQVIDAMIQQNPMLRNVPNAREIITSPMMRQLLTNPALMSSMMRVRRSMEDPSGGGFPMPGATETTPQSGREAGAGNAQQGQQPPNPFMFNPAMFAGMGAGAGANPADGQPNDPAATMSQLSQLMQEYQRTMGMPRGAPTAEEAPGGDAAGAQTTPPAGNPFANLFGGFNPEMMESLMQMNGGGMGAQTSPPDNRPPEERYAEQLRQLNDMGFFDFDRNVAALRRSGGSVQGAIEHLLSATD